MSTAKVVLTITPTELELLRDALTNYVDFLAHIEAAACGRPLPPADVPELIFTDRPFDGQQMANRLIRELS